MIRLSIFSVIICSFITTGAMKPGHIMIPVDGFCVHGVPATPIRETVCQYDALLDDVAPTLEESGNGFFICEEANHAEDNQVIEVFFCYVDSEGNEHYIDCTNDFDGEYESDELFNSVDNMIVFDLSSAASLLDELEE